MKAWSYFTTLFAGLALLAGGSFHGAQAAPVVGFAAGGRTTAGTYPVGNPTGVTFAGAANGFSQLGIDIPINTSIYDNYMVAGNCAWLQPALAAEGYVFGNGANQWKINLVALPVAAISLTTYSAYVNTKPAATGGLSARPPLLPTRS